MSHLYNGHVELLMDGRDLDVPSQDGKQPISCSRTIEETQRTRRSRTDVPLDSSCYLFSRISSEDYLSGLLMDCCIEVSKLFHFSDALYDSESC